MHSDTNVSAHIDMELVSLLALTTATQPHHQYHRTVLYVVTHCIAFSPDIELMLPQCLVL